MVFDLYILGLEHMWLGLEVELALKQKSMQLFWVGITN